MEETEIIYDLESQEKENPNPAVGNEHNENSEGTGNSGDTDTSDCQENTEVPTESEVTADTDGEEATKAEEKSPAETELGEMISRLGADTLLQIIKDNRNAAIRQIIAEVESSRDSSIPSGTSSAPSCTSIFDLASMA